MIDTLVFDYGGVIVNLDDAAVMSVLDSLGIFRYRSALQRTLRLAYAPSSRIRWALQP